MATRSLEEIKKEYSEAKAEFDALQQRLAYLAMEIVETSGVVSYAPSRVPHMDKVGQRDGFKEYALKALAESGKPLKLGQIFRRACEMGWTSNAQSKEYQKKVASQALRGLRDDGAILWEDGYYSLAPEE